MSVEEDLFSVRFQRAVVMSRRAVVRSRRAFVSCKRAVVRSGSVSDM